jgi:hypothetical protein
MQLPPRRLAWAQLQQQQRISLRLPLFFLAGALRFGRASDLTAEGSGRVQWRSDNQRTAGGGGRVRR